ncbi:MAG: hypothetical protein V4620_12715 [Bacteroidota bacterium]
MNAIQLITKINTRIEDLAMYSSEILKPHADLSEVEKEVLKRNCADLYELILRLKTTNDLNEEQIQLKENISNELKKEELNFKDIVMMGSQEELSINNIAEVAETTIQQTEVAPNIVFFEPEPTVVVPVQEETPAPVEEIVEQPAIINDPVIVAEVRTEPIIAATPVEEIIVEPKAEEIIETRSPVTAPHFEINTSAQEPKEKPAPFFSIGKTVMPATEISLNEKMAHNKEGFQHAEKIVEPKIDSLKTAISLNKKIAFVNELFKENVVEYAKSIDKINSADDLTEANLIWTELKISHNWSHDNALVKDLEKLIQRRFS